MTIGPRAAFTNGVNALAITPGGMRSIGLVGFNPALAFTKNSSAPANINGFSNLISALFGSQETAEATAPQPNLASNLFADATTEQTATLAAKNFFPPPTKTSITQTAAMPSELTVKTSVASRARVSISAKPAPAKKIADAMIRSMLGERRESPTAKAEATTALTADSASLANVRVNVSKPLTADDAPLEQDVALAQPAAAAPANEIATNQPQAPLAFGAVLTPLQPGIEAAPSQPEMPASAPWQAQPAVDSESGPATKLVQAVATKAIAHAQAAAAGQETAPREVSRIAPIAQTASSTDSFARAFENTAPAPMSQVQASSKPAPVFGNVAQALHTSEMPVTAPPLNGAPIHDIAVRISRPDQPAIDLHIAERAGEIRVAVRTPDAPLATSLRQDLPALANSLERAGYRAETFVPHQAAGTPLAAQSAKSGAHDEQQQQSSSQRDAHQPSQGRQQRHRDRNLQHWLNEMEKQA